MSYLDSNCSFSLQRLSLRSIVFIHKSVRILRKLCGFVFSPPSRSSFFDRYIVLTPRNIWECSRQKCTSKYRLMWAQERSESKIVTLEWVEVSISHHLLQFEIVLPKKVKSNWWNEHSIAVHSFLGPYSHFISYHYSEYIVTWGLTLASSHLWL